MAKFNLNVSIMLDEYELNGICECLQENHNIDLTTAEIIAKPAVAKYIASQIAQHLADHWNDVGLEMVADPYNEFLSDIESKR